MEKEERTAPVSKRGWSLSTHFINTAVITLSSLCFVMTGIMWFSCSDQGAMAETILSLFK